jgi:hypothetical protein
MPDDPDFKPARDGIRNSALCSVLTSRQSRTGASSRGKLDRRQQPAHSGAVALPPSGR